MGNETDVTDIVEQLERSAVLWGSAGVSVFEDIGVSRSLCRVTAAEAEAAAREIARLRAEADRLKAAIRKHRDQRGDDRCWLDDRELYAAIGEADTADLALPPECEFLESCRRYWRKRQDPGQSVGHDPGRMTMAELEADNVRLRAAAGLGPEDRS
jgi:hypothetical protein